MIVWTIQSLNLDLADMDVLHINQVNNLSPLFFGARSICETQYHAQEEFGAEIGGLINQDLSNLTFPDESFDLAIHSETLEHTFDFERSLAEVQRVLRPGGIQIYTIPLLHSRPTLQRVRFRDNEVIEHLQPPSSHGFDDEDLVVWEFGGDFIRGRERPVSRIFYDNFCANPTVFTIVEKART